MSRVRVGIVGYAKARPYRLGLAAVLGASGLGSSVLAAEASSDEATEVSAVTVTGERRPLNAETGLSVLPTTVQDTPQAVNVIFENVTKDDWVIGGAPEFGKTTTK